MKFKVTGLAPAHCKQANELLKVCGLGVEGAFVYKVNEVELSLTEEDTDKVAAFLHEYYENALGWHDVVVALIADKGGT